MSRTCVRVSAGFLSIVAAGSAFADDFQSPKLSPGIVMQAGALKSSVLSPAVVTQGSGLQSPKLLPGVVVSISGLQSPKISTGIVVEVLPGGGSVLRAPLTHW